MTPLVARNRSIGVIVADNLYSGAPITEDSVNLLTAFAGHAAVALENAELYGRLEHLNSQLAEKIQELERTQGELVLSERLAAIGEMSARIAHEIRNPLATVGGFARSVLKKPEPGRVETACNIIVEEVERLEGLLNNTLNFARPTQPRLQEVSLPELLHETHRMLASDLQNQQIVYRQHIVDGLPDIHLDVDQVKQVLINLLKNAIQAMPSGGNLQVAARLVPSPAWAANGSGEFVAIEIQDTGVGIEPEHMNQLFNPFFTTKTYGTGLGLVISKKIVEDHRGMLTLESQPGEGTTVRILLPVQPVSSEG